MACFRLRLPRELEFATHTLAENDMTAFFQRLVGTRLYAPVAVAGTTGLRRGELLASAGRM